MNVKLTGVCKVYENQAAFDNNKDLEYPYPHLEQYIRDMKILCVMISDGPLKSFSFVSSSGFRLSFFSIL